LEVVKAVAKEAVAEMAVTGEGGEEERAVEAAAEAAASNASGPRG